MTTNVRLTDQQVEKLVNNNNQASGYPPGVTVGMVAQHIVDGSTGRGLDPNTMLAVAANEGLYSWKSSVPGETSYGAFQLYTTGNNGGVGDTFKKSTGLDPSNAENWKQSNDFALNYISNTKDLTPWHGWNGPTNAGIPSDSNVLPITPGGILAGGNISYSQAALDGQIESLQNQINALPPGASDARAGLEEELSRLKAVKASGGFTGGRNANGSPAIGGGGKVLIQDLKCNLPEPIGTNQIHNLRNYTYRLIISTLTVEEYNQFVGGSKSADKLGSLSGETFPKAKSILIASGGENLNAKNEYGVQDFFFQDLVLQTTPSATGAGLQVSYSTDIDFTLVEPLGTTLFERLFYASKGKATLRNSGGSPISETAKNASETLRNQKSLKGLDQGFVQSLTEPVFLLTIEFKGYNGYTKVSSSGKGTANFLLDRKSTSGDFSKKYHIPFIFSSIDTDITSAGTVYKCKALPAASQVFFTINQAIPATSSIKENQKLSDALKELSDRFTDNQKNLPDGFKPVKYVFRIADDNDLPADDTEAKSIARELRDSAWFRSEAPVDASRITFMPPKTSEQKTSGRIPGTTSGTTGFRPDKNQTYFTGMGTTAIEVIHQIMLKTNFITDQVKLARSGKAESGIWWYNIRGNMLIDTAKDDKKSPHVEQGKIFEYVIEPYKVMVANDIDNNDFCKGAPKTFRNYEYIYTGKNSDIIKWDLTFDGLLYTELQVQEPGNTSAQMGQPKTNSGQATNASGQKKGTANQSNISFPIADQSKVNNNNHQKLYKAGWFGTDPKNSDAGRVKNYTEMQNSSFMESLFRMQTSSQQWMLDIDIVGDPEYLSLFDALSYKRKEPKSKPNPTTSLPEAKSNRFDTKKKTAESLSSQGQLLIGLKFKTPTDIDPRTLSYKGTKSADLNGVYVLTSIKHMFRNGKFIQTLDLVGTDNKCCPMPKIASGLTPGGGKGGSGGTAGVGAKAATGSVYKDKQKQLESLDQQIADAKKEQDPERLAQLYQSREQLSNDIAAIKGQYVNPEATAPIPGATISSGWTRTNGDPHGAIDYEAQVGTEIQASVDGKVIAAQWQNPNIQTGKEAGYGKFMVVERKEADGTTTHIYMAHLSDYKVEVGSDVKNTDVIALSGNTGSSSGPHLHYEVRTNATPGQIYTGTKIPAEKYNPSAVK